MQPSVPTYQQPADDPAYLALKQRAQDDQAAAASDTVRMDSATLLARYGTLVSLANAGSPTSPGSPVSPVRGGNVLPIVPGRSSVTATGALPPIARVG